MSIEQVLAGVPKIPVMYYRSCPGMYDIYQRVYVLGRVMEERFLIDEERFLCVPADDEEFPRFVCSASELYLERPARD